jgi:predicted Zn-dependent protease
MSLYQLRAIVSNTQSDGLLITDWQPRTDWGRQQALWLAGRGALLADRPATAIAPLKELVGESPSRPIVWPLLAQAYQATAQTQDAIQVYTQAKWGGASS